MRYNLAEIQSDSSTEALLQIWSYEACRIFHDRLVDLESRKEFLNILSNVLQDEWRSGSIVQKLSRNYFLLTTSYLFSNNL